MVQAVVLVGIFVRSLIRGGAVLGDFLGERGTFNLSISRRPLTRAAARRYLEAARHPVRRLSTFRALIGFAVLAVGLAVVVAWLIYSFSMALPSGRL